MLLKTTICHNFVGKEVLSLQYIYNAHESRIQFGLFRWILLFTPHRWIDGTGDTQKEGWVLKSGMIFNLNIHARINTHLTHSYTLILYP